MDTVSAARNARTLGRADRPRIRYTVAFPDHQSHNRQVTGTDTLDWASIPRAGDPVAVWFDPARPGDEDSTIVDPTSLPFGSKDQRCS